VCHMCIHHHCNLCDTNRKEGKSAGSCGHNDEPSDCVKLGRASYLYCLYGKKSHGLTPPHTLEVLRYPLQCIYLYSPQVVWKVGPRDNLFSLQARNADDVTVGRGREASSDFIPSARKTSSRMLSIAETPLKKAFLRHSDVELNCLSGCLETVPYLFYFVSVMRCVSCDSVSIKQVFRIVFLPHV
jgi:hypothetical protein